MGWPQKDIQNPLPQEVYYLKVARGNPPGQHAKEHPWKPSTNCPLFLKKLCSGEVRLPWEDKRENEFQREL